MKPSASSIPALAARTARNDASILLILLFMASSVCAGGYFTKAKPFFSACSRRAPRMASSRVPAPAWSFRLSLT